MWLPTFPFNSLLLLPVLIQVTLSLHTHLQQALDSVTGLAVNNSQIQPGLLGMLTAPRRWIKSWLRTITVEQSAETVLPVTDWQTMPLSYSLRDFDLTRVISIFMNPVLYHSLLLHMELPSLKWKWIQNITSSEKHSQQQMMLYPLCPIIFSAAALNALKIWKIMFSFPVLSRGVGNLPKGWLQCIIWVSHNSSKGQI